MPAKVTGRFPYINNLRVRGMLHGRVIRPPSVGAKLEGVDEGSIKDVAGIVQVVREGNFLGVVAQSEWGAIKGPRQLKARPAPLPNSETVSYPVIRFPDVPEIVLDLIDRPNAPPWGAGEPAAAVVPSAISKAVFDATGVRLRSVPYTPEKVKAAMRSGAGR